MDVDERGRLTIDDLPAIHAVAFLEDPAFHVCRRRRAIQHPARDTHALLGTVDLDAAFLSQLDGADRRAMHVADVRQIEKIVIDQLIVRLNVVRGAGSSERRIAHAVKIRNGGALGQIRLPHPHPYPAMPLGDPVDLDPRLGRNPILAWDPCARAVRVEHQTVIAALDLVAEHASEMERGMAVNAPILQGRKRAVLLPEQHDRLV
jgi:hypothetical protein